MELDGDIIESIRAFDVNSQLSIKEMAHFTLVPKIQSDTNHNTFTSIFSYLPEDTILLSIDMPSQLERLAKAWERYLQDHQTAIDLKSEVIPKHPKELWMTPKEWLNGVQKFTNIYLGGERPTDKHRSITSIINKL